MKIGVLALQGDFDAHCKVISHLGHQDLEIRTCSQIEELDGLILPGGESSAMLKLLNKDLEIEIINAVQNGMGIFGTCAGLILLANKVENPNQRSLNLLPVTVERNSYGRQVNSFITDEIEIQNSLKQTGLSKTSGIFIRAPKITSVDSNIEILATHNNTPVMVRYNKIFGCSFHPELANKDEIQVKIPYLLHEFIFSCWKSS